MHQYIRVYAGRFSPANERLCSRHVPGTIAAEKSLNLCAWDIACLYVLLSLDCFTSLYLVFNRNICVGQVRHKTTIKSGQVLRRETARASVRYVCVWDGGLRYVFINPFKTEFYLNNI
jgi:hypothetical protein